MKDPTVATLFKALTDENRLKILVHIQKQSPLSCDADCAEDGVCVTSLAQTMGVTTATASHHIKELVYAGWLVTTKRGRRVYCHVNREALEKASVFLKQLQEG